MAEGLDPKPLLEQLASVPTAEPEEEGFPYYGPVKWRKITEWTHKKKGAAIYNEYNIVLQFVTIMVENATGRLLPNRYPSRHRPGTLSEAWPLVHALNNAAGGDPDCIGHVIITRLPGSGKIGAHIDRCPTIPGLPYWQRHQIPLQVFPGVVFACDKEELYMKPGNGYWFDNQKMHSVHNGSGRDRISMVVEIRPMSSSA